MTPAAMAFLINLSIVYVFDWLGGEGYDHKLNLAVAAALAFVVMLLPQ